MRYKIVYDKYHRNNVTIHLDLNLLDFCPKQKKRWSLEEEDDFWNDGDSVPPLFLNRIRLIRGVEQASFSKYNIEIIKGELFTWPKIIRQIISDLRITLNKGKQAKKIGMVSKKNSRRKNIPMIGVN